MIYSVSCSGQPMLNAIQFCSLEYIQSYLNEREEKQATFEIQIFFPLLFGKVRHFSFFLENQISTGNHNEKKTAGVS